jgi:hypothetical protein
MAIQVNTRLDESEWEKVVEAMPGLSNGERMSQLVRLQITLFESRHNLTRALEHIDAALTPSLQAMKEQRLHGKGSDLAETLALAVTEMAALLLSHTDAMLHSPEKALPEVENALVRRWSRASLQVLRAAVLDPAVIRNAKAVQPEIQRLLDQIKLLQSVPTAPSFEKSS